MTDKYGQTKNTNQLEENQMEENELEDYDEEYDYNNNSPIISIENSPAASPINSRINSEINPRHRTSQNNSIQNNSQHSLPQLQSHISNHSIHHSIQQPLHHSLHNHSIQQPLHNQPIHNQPVFRNPFESQNPSSYNNQQRPRYSHVTNELNQIEQEIPISNRNVLMETNVAQSRQLGQKRNISVQTGANPSNYLLAMAQQHQENQYIQAANLQAAKNQSSNFQSSNNNVHVAHQAQTQEQIDLRLLLDSYAFLRSKWGMTNDMMKMTSLNGGIRRHAIMWNNFVTDFDDIDFDDVKRKYLHNQAELAVVLRTLHKTPKDKYCRALVDMEIQIPKMMKVCEAMYESLLGFIKAEEYTNPTANVPVSLKSILKDTEIVGKNEKERILFRMYSSLIRDNYRRYNDECWEEIRSPEGYQTHAFQRVCTIEDYIRSKSNRHLDPDNWSYIDGSTNAKSRMSDLVFSLIHSEDVDFPTVSLSRHKFSFTNGIFLTKIVDRTEYNHKTGRTDNKYRCQFYPYDSQEILYVDNKQCSAKYFNQQFVPYDDNVDWYSIPTPCLQSIFEYQFASREDVDEICRMIYVLIGRMLYDRGELDGWEVVPFIQGVGGAGKSTISKYVLKQFYNLPQIAEIDNKIEKQFGLGPLLEKNPLITIGDELDDSCQLDLTQFLKMVSGETLTAATKGGKPMYVEWPSHMWLSGNQLPSWEDKGGALSRRIVSIFYRQMVRSADKDTNLGQRIKEEIPNIMQKCVRGYLEMVNNHSNEDFWNFCPSYFKEAQSELQKVSNIIRSFIESEEIIFDKGGVVLESDFLARMKIYAEGQNVRISAGALRHKNFSINNVIQQINDSRGDTSLSYEKKNVTIGNKHYNKAMCLFGIRFRTDEDDIDNDDNGQNKDIDLINANIKGKIHENNDDIIIADHSNDKGKEELYSDSSIDTQKSVSNNIFSKFLKQKNSKQKNSKQLYDNADEEQHDIDIEFDI